MNSHPARTPNRLTRLAVAIAAGSLATAAQAENIIGGLVTWPAGSTQFISDDTRFTGSLTIEPGVLVLVTGDHQIRFDDGATLTATGTDAEPIVFEREATNGSWGGLSFLPGSTGELSNVQIFDFGAAALQADAATVTMTDSLIADLFTPGGTGTRTVLSARNAADLMLTRNTIGPVSGRTGSTGSTPGAPSGAGANGGSGGPGSPGSNLVVLRIDNNATATVVNNRFDHLSGGRGGLGGNGRSGNTGSTGSTGTITSPTGGTGGRGGNGGSGGAGGDAGFATGFLFDNPGAVLVAQNIIDGFTGGRGGNGGAAGNGGRGGRGGTGTGGVFTGGDGGTGGRGGDGGRGGNAGDPGGSRLFDVRNIADSANTTRIVNNTVVGIGPGELGTPAARGNRGAGGAGGSGGDGIFGDGSSGATGPVGSHGSAGSAATPQDTTALRANASGSGGLVRQYESRNNIYTFVAATGTATAFESLGTEPGTADYDLVSGQDIVATGTNFIGLNLVFDAPAFVDAANGDFTPAAGSPVINAGDDTELPADVTDVDADGNTLEALPRDFAGSRRVRDGQVDLGAVEVPGPDGCSPADLAEPFGTLDIDDVLSFLNGFSSGDPSADLAAPFGEFNIDDVLTFLSAFSAGCP